MQKLASHYFVLLFKGFSLGALSLFADIYKQKRKQAPWKTRINAAFVRPFACFYICSSVNGPTPTMSSEQRPLCRYFNSPRGCRRGHRCPFEHTIVWCRNGAYCVYPDCIYRHPATTAGAFGASTPTATTSVGVAKCCVKLDESNNDYASKVSTCGVAGCVATTIDDSDARLSSNTEVDEVVMPCLWFMVFMTSHKLGEGGRLETAVEQYRRIRDQYVQPGDEVTTWLCNDNTGVLCRVANPEDAELLKAHCSGNVRLRDNVGDVLQYLELDDVYRTGMASRRIVGGSSAYVEPRAIHVVVLTAGDTCGDRLTGDQLAELLRHPKMLYFSITFAVIGPSNSDMVLIRQLTGHDIRHSNYMRVVPGCPQEMRLCFRHTLRVARVPVAADDHDSDGVESRTIIIGKGVRRLGTHAVP